MQTFECKENESLGLACNVQVTVIKIIGDKVWLGISAPPNIGIAKTESMRVEIARVN